tara:strand:- start:128 stop:355 length:228 start_codon:yes stop_codon:yes gene_type:complete
MTKDNKQKTRSAKKYRYTAEEVSEIVGCSESYVKKVRSGASAQKSSLSQQIIAVDEVLVDQSNALIREVERMVKI